MSKRFKEPARCCKSPPGKPYEHSEDCPLEQALKKLKDDHDPNKLRAELARLREENTSLRADLELVHADTVRRAIASLQQRAEAAEAKLAKLADLAREMLPYVPEYFRDKWGYDKELSALLDGEGGGA